MDGKSRLNFCFSLYLMITTISSAVDSLNTTGSLRDGDAIVSADGSFVLEFFSPGSSSKRYLGIRYGYVLDPTYVWVANRENPIADTSGLLTIEDMGFLVLRNGNGSLVWSTNSSRPARNPVAQLLDTGNLLVKNEGETNLEECLWQSFDYPTDTLLPGMKFGKDLVTGLDRYLSSWKSSDDPSPSSYSYAIDPLGYPEFVLKRNSTKRFRSGPWNGVRLSGLPYISPNPTYTFDFVFEKNKEVYYIYQLLNRSTISRLVVTSAGLVQRFVWTRSTGGWNVFWYELDNCDYYGTCGANGRCNVSSSRICSCFHGFVPRQQQEWDSMDWTNGCIRRTDMNCSGDGFQKISGVKLPETQNVWFNKSISLDVCKSLCLRNCSCMAYASMDIRDGSGCFHWFGDLIDMRQLEENGQDIYIRLAGSEIEEASTVNNGSNSKKKQCKATIISSICVGGLLLGAIIFYIWRKNNHIWRKKLQQYRKSESQREELELRLFDFNTITHATNNFSVNNILGQGGFGLVYKGTLKDGKQIAVKRLSKHSRQGAEEFKNEVRHIANLQHRNLVKLLGCCIQAEEKMLIYEFMPNKSLDFFIFDKERNLLLDWHMRFKIINGIARGLLYLHQDSRLRIIHRDLKASNILLDCEMNAKISDFGMARSFGGPETQANTTKVVGTYGYMSPEYVINGVYSVKSDVFGFGVLVLEMVKGQRNWRFGHPDHNLNLLGHAWTLYNEGRSSELVSKFLRDSCDLDEVLRAVKIGLLCVQRNPDDRPPMSSVVLMLEGERKLPEPKLPGFFTERELMEATFSLSASDNWSANDLTVTVMEAR